MKRGNGGAAAVFRGARDVLLAHPEDLDAARSAFPCRELAALTEFNWALDWFDRLAEGKGRATALHLVGEHGDETVSFTRLAERSGQVACHLRSLGVRRGDPVLLAPGSGPAVWEATLAVIKLGAVAVPARVDASAAEFAERIARAGVRHVVAAADSAPRFGNGPWTRVAVGGEVRGWERYEDCRAIEETFQPDGPTPSDAPLVCFLTSGTTGRPKMVVHTHGGYPVGQLTTMYWNGLRPGDRHLNAAVPGTAEHVWGSILAPWNAGATVVGVTLPDRILDARDVLDVLRTREVTTCCAPPSVWHAIGRERLGKRPEWLREAVSTGERLDPRLVEAVLEAWDVRVREGYGQTETVVQVGVPPGRSPDPALRSMGWPLPGCPVGLLDSPSSLFGEPGESSGEPGETGEPGEPGEIVVELREGSLGLMSGYAGDLERTARARSGGRYRTGDLAVPADDGSWRYAGRAEDVFRSSDQLIIPLELEDVLVRHPAVVEAAVVAFPDSVAGWTPKAFLVLEEGRSADQELAADVFDLVRRELSPEKWVRVVEFMGALPRTATGKVRRSALRAAPRTRGGPEYRMRSAL
ncbi:acyl-CoA synthetase [Wenjunlia tyrosinilytica]|uniref:AMP-dependent synthetase n=1 Tax=Wenjunlia tyrosinilytica TaxID=1544741 RepID=A0A917ZN83_9ACTN|nr:AMP-binding protein [Wenjunlia tyrosinilytica]GGO86594.1 AMP-dependent synthetase [Wenjunlia tyrosinilytica]